MSYEENQGIPDPFSEPEPEPTPSSPQPSPNPSPAAEALKGEGFLSNIDQKMWIIIGIVAAILLVLCCCCSAIVIFLYNNGDQIINELEQMGMVLSLFV